VKIGEEAKAVEAENKKEKFMGLVKKVWGNILKVGKVAIKEMFAMWENSVLFEFITKWSSCIKVATALVGVGAQIYALVTFIILAVGSHGASLVPHLPLMVISLVCQWPNVVEAIQKFIHAWKTDDINEKFYSYGYVVGKIFGIMLSVVTVMKKRRKYKRYLKLI